MKTAIKDWQYIKTNNIWSVQYATGPKHATLQSTSGKIRISPDGVINSNWMPKIKEGRYTWVHKLDPELESFPDTPFEKINDMSWFKVYDETGNLYAVWSRTTDVLNSKNNLLEMTTGIILGSRKIRKNN